MSITSTRLNRFNDVVEKVLVSPTLNGHRIGPTCLSVIWFTVEHRSGTAILKKGLPKIRGTRGSATYQNRLRHTRARWTELGKLELEKSRRLINLGLTAAACETYSWILSRIKKLPPSEAGQLLVRMTIPPQVYTTLLDQLLRERELSLVFLSENSISTPYHSAQPHRIETAGVEGISYSLFENKLPCIVIDELDFARR
ncbi:hypothetical protein Tco_0728976 [Tanacetum coccineum]|uniref:Uncharacterized protein n=1 Tax=Tanacetum coccineum TaxID=301880 RepID=A0ABQ4YN42_9ASTR